MIQADRHTIIQILGGLMNQPNILSDTDKYLLEPNDFLAPLDRYVFSAIYNLYTMGAESIRTIDIVGYLKSNSSATKLIDENNGLAFIQDCEANGNYENFSYYYNKLKKINLVRDLQKDNTLDEIYCDDPLSDRYAEINERFEKMSATDIINSLKLRDANLEHKYSINSVVEESNPADGIRDLIEELKKKPEVGCKLQGDIFNTITRGGRKGKFYLRSSGTSIGKTRQMVGDACHIAYPIRFDSSCGQWVSTGSCEKVLYVMTEQETEEIDTMILAYLTDINEELFIYGTFGEEHMQRIEAATQIMEKYKDNFLYAKVPDPCSSVIKNLFRRYNLQFGVENFFYDYIFSSPAMLNEYRDLKIPEHVALRLFSTTLKNLAVELNSFVMSSTQISGDEDPKGGFRDYKNIRGQLWGARLYLFQFY